MSIKLSGVLWTILMMFLLLVPSGGEARQQTKPAEVSDDNRVYKLTEVDEKAIIDRKSFVSSSPSSMGCKEDAGLTRLIVVLRKTGKITDVALRDSSVVASLRWGFVTGRRYGSPTPLPPSRRDR